VWRATGNYKTQIAESKEIIHTVSEEIATENAAAIILTL
jgi:hypothetical protein